jgi:F420-dependent oxidoreductase-like protein
VVHEGDHYQLPYSGEDATGLGKPLQLITHPRHDLPITIASIGPKNVALTAEIADGWLPVLFSPTKAREVFEPLLDEGFAAAADSDKRARFQIVPATTAIITDDVDRARMQVKPNLALYIGGMGARNRNFYNSLVRRYGYEAEAAHIQDLYLAGKRKEATMAVPDALVDELHLIGPAGAVRDQLAAWREAGVTELSLSTPDLHTLRTLPELL